MSKLYKKYVILKIKNSQKIYLFEAGIFYLFIDEDAKLMAKELDLRLTNLNKNIVKCGFPVKSLDKYIHILRNLNYNIEIVPSDDESTSFDLNSYIVDNKLLSIVDDFLAVDIDELSIGQAFDLLNKLQNNLKDIMKEKDDNEK